MPDRIVGTGHAVIDIRTGHAVIVGSGHAVILGTGHAVILGTGHALSLRKRPDPAKRPAPTGKPSGGEFDNTP